MTRVFRKPHVVIVGGGFAGLEVAKRLSRAPVDITLVDRCNHHLFQPLLYQVATAGLSPDQIAVPIRSILRGQDNCRVLLDTVTHVDTLGKHVELLSGVRLAYDYVVMAAGARTTFFGNDEWQRHVFALKSLRDAIQLRERILTQFERANRTRDDAERKQLTSFAVVGGGPLGVELAGALAELGRTALAREYENIDPDDVRVILVEMADRVLAPFHPSLSAHAQRQLEELGVEVRTSTRVQDVHSDALVTDDGLLQVGTVCWAPGVEAVRLGYHVQAEQEKDGRVRVGQHCSLPHLPNVFAIGDVASFRPDGEDGPLPALAPVALQQGRHVARCIESDLEGRERKPFRYLDKGIMATVGRSRAVAEAGRLRLHGFPAWVAWLAVHLYFLVGFRNRLTVLFDWCWSYFTRGYGARVIQEDARELLEQRPSVAPRGSAPPVERHGHAH